MGESKKSEETKAKAGSVPHGGMPGDGAGRIEDPGTQHAGVWPMSGPLPPDPNVRAQGMASFGQGERGAAGYEDSGQSELITVPPDEMPSAGGSAGGSGVQARGVGEVGSNAGEVDLGISGSGETIGEPPESVVGGGLGNAVDGGGEGDVPETADRPSR
jgi:hypothetical protein